MATDLPLMRIPARRRPHVVLFASVALLTVASLTVVLTGCFNPNLPETPFKCATTGKACPDGYGCAVRAGQPICVRGGEPDGGSDQRVPPPDAAPSKDARAPLDGALVKPANGCLDEAQEPNNTGRTATVLLTRGKVTGWEICYPGDIDQYAVQLTQGQNLDLSIQFRNSDGDLDLALVDPGGFVIRESRSETNVEQIQYTVPKSGRYVIGVYGFGKAVNSYDIVLQY